MPGHLPRSAAATIRGMDPEKMVFLFDEVPAGFDPDDPADRAELLADQLTDGVDTMNELRFLVAAAEQIATGEPPEVWSAAARLLACGLDRTETLHQLALAAVPPLETVLDGTDLAPSDHLAALSRLPVPTRADAGDALLAAARERQPLDYDELVALAVERLGEPPDDPMVEHLLDVMIDRLSDGGPLAMLASGTVHVESLTAGVIATHRLSAAEQRTGMLEVAVDLAAFGHHTELWLPSGEQLQPTEDADELITWLGPDGWLDEFPAGDLLAVRVDGAGIVTLTALDVEPVAPEPLVPRVRESYDAEVAEPWLPVTAEELVFALLARDRAALATPVPPLSELAAAAGLQRRGDEFAHEESVWLADAATGRAARLLGRLDGPQARIALEVLELVEAGVPDRDAARDVLAGLYDPDVLDAVWIDLLGTDDDPDLLAATAELSERLLAVASRPAELAVAHWLAALVAERRGEVLDGESHLRAAVRAEPDWLPALDRLSWYASDRGDAAGALELLYRAGATAELSPDVETLERFVGTAGPRVGRNQPCWCGSGRKFKVCHLGTPAMAPLPERVDWLCRKAAAYLERRGGATAVDLMEYAEVRAVDLADEDSIRKAFEDPLVLDALLHEGGWFDRFLADRGPLLPADEAMLGQAWTLVARTVYEVLSTRPGAGVVVRDLRTGDRIDVRERTFSQDADVGALVCGRAVPDGESHQFVGGLFPVAPGTERTLLDMLDGRDGFELLAYVAAMHRPPRLVSRDGEPLVACRALLEVPDPALARTELEGAYEPDGDSWVWSVEIADDERRLLATLSLAGRDLTVQTLTETHLDEVLTDLRTALPGCRVVSDERRPVDPSTLPTGPGPEPVPIPPEALEPLMDRYERRWCDEHVPALDGRTPRAAVADPTRRADVARLIRTFPDIDPASGAFGLRPQRLLALLGLDQD